MNSDTSHFSNYGIHKPTQEERQQNQQNQNRDSPKDTQIGL